MKKYSALSLIFTAFCSLYSVNSLEHEASTAVEVCKSLPDIVRQCNARFSPTYIEQVAAATSTLKDKIHAINVCLGTDSPVLLKALELHVYHCTQNIANLRKYIVTVHTISNLNEDVFGELASVTITNLNNLLFSTANALPCLSKLAKGKLLI